MTLHVLLDLLSRFYYELNPMACVMSSYSRLVILSREVAILTHAEVNAIRADETATDDWPHVATDALVIIMS